MMREDAFLPCLLLLQSQNLNFLLCLLMPLSWNYHFLSWFLLNEITLFVSVNVLQKEIMVIALSPRPSILLFGTCLFVIGVNNEAKWFKILLQTCGAFSHIQCFYILVCFTHEGQHAFHFVLQFSFGSISNFGVALPICLISRKHKPRMHTRYLCTFNVCKASGP